MPYLVSGTLQLAESAKSSCWKVGPGRKILTILIMAISKRARDETWLSGLGV